MSTAVIALVVLAFGSGVILLLRDWRITVPALLFTYGGIALFLWQSPLLVPDLLIEQSLTRIVFVKLITGIGVTLILLITGLTFAQDYGLEELDEFGLSELRRAARAAQRQRASTPRRLSEYAVPLLLLVLVLLTSLALPRIYPIAPLLEVDFVWYWLGLTGLFTLVTANTLLKIGLGLLLSLASMDFLYTAVLSTPQTRGVGLVPLLLLSLVTILLALAIAYLSGLLYGRMKTLDLAALE